MDFSFMAKHLPLYVEAAKLTVMLAFWGVLLSLIIGILCSLVSFYKIRSLSWLTQSYIELSRNTPLLIQLFFLYYGLPQMGIKLGPQTCAIVGLAFLGGSYMAEAFRSGIDAVSKSQIESGLSIGLTKNQLARYIIMPQALAIAMPAIGANVIFLLKETSVFSAIAMADLMFVAKDLIGMYYKTDEALFMLVIAYLIILLPLGLLFTYWERRIRYAGFGR